MTLKTLLVAFDGSPYSERALVAAEELAKTSGARLVLASVLGPVPVVAGEFTALQEPSAAAREDARFTLDRRAEVLRSRGIAVETCVETGDAAGALLQIAERFDADLLVAGRSGKGAVARLLVGSCTTTLLHRTRRPIFVVP